MQLTDFKFTHMKIKYLYIILLFCFIQTLNAQGNLQFNRVVNESYTSNFTTDNKYQELGTFTVPQGKVLKITHASFFAISTSYPNNPPVTDYNKGSFFIGDTVLIKSTESSSDVSQPAFNSIWLAEGTYAIKGAFNTTTSRNLTYAFSGIEFNVIAD